MLKFNFQKCQRNRESKFGFVLFVQVNYKSKCYLLTRENYKTMNCVVCFGDCYVYYLLYLVIRPNYKTMNCVVCFGDCLKFPKCIIFCVHWLSGFQTPTLTVANKPHIYYLKQIIRQWIVWSALVTASYLLNVLSIVLFICPLPHVCYSY